MTQLHEDYERVSSNLPCPVCGKPDWCMVARDRASTLCQRVRSSRRWREAGWYHGPRRRRGHRRGADTILIDPDQRLMTDQHEAMWKVIREMGLKPESPDTDPAIAWLADHLGVSVTSLNRLSVGYMGVCENRWAQSTWPVGIGAFTFPMVGPEGRWPIGIRTREPDGTKRAIRGSRNGLFVPTKMTGEGPLLICEGESDTAAALDMGVDAIGRPGATGGVSLIRQYILEHGRRQVVIVADSDAIGSDGIGLQGARRLAKQLYPVTQETLVITPPPGVKDLRRWRTVYHATQLDLDMQIDIERRRQQWLVRSH